MIIEHHGGRVWVESEFGVGSNFYWIYLQLSTANLLVTTSLASKSALSVDSLFLIDSSIFSNKDSKSEGLHL